jgi:hypothetical protein
MMLLGLACLLPLLLGVPAMYSADWPRFRGPDGSGVSESRGLPAEFGPNKNVVWKAVVPPSVSSPVLSGNRIVLAAAIERRRMIICLDSRTGRRVWERSIGVTHPHHRHPLNDPASPTPLIDGSNVYAFFPEYGLVAYDLTGKGKWKTELGPFVSLHGISASPVLAGDAIILLIDQAKGSFVAAFNTKDGHERWRTERPDAAGGYSTPVVYAVPGRTSQVVVSSPRELAGYSAATGAKLWWVGQMGEQPQTSPILWHDMVFAVGTGGSDTWEGDEVFRQLDVNRDGFVDATEFPKAWGPIAGTVLDENGDGKLSLAEWNAFGARIHGGGPSALVVVGLEGRGDATQTEVRWRFASASIRSFANNLPGYPLSVERRRRSDRARCANRPGPQTGPNQRSNGRRFFFPGSRGRQDFYHDRERESRSPKSGARLDDAGGE